MIQKGLIPYTSMRTFRTVKRLHNRENYDEKIGIGKLNSILLKNSKIAKFDCEIL